MQAGAKVWTSRANYRYGRNWECEISDVEGESVSSNLQECARM